MSLKFGILDVEPHPYAVAPCLLARLEVAADQPVRSLTLNIQIRLEIRRRAYSSNEVAGLREVLGESERWGPSLLLTQVHQTLPSFTEKLEVEVPVPCTYDMDVAASKYFDSLEGGIIPLLFLFSGTIFRDDGRGMQVEPLPWDREARYDLPLERWRSMMNGSAPNKA
jgi:hypothetical protein